MHFHTIYPMLRQLSLWTLLSFPLLILAQQSLSAERVLLHTDRDLYLIGEQIQFKAYCLADDRAADAVMSQVIYLELHDARKQRLTGAKFALTAGESHGTITIPGDLPSGVYYLRAYTRYMRNGGPGAFCYLPLRIVNPEAGLPLSPSETAIAPETEVSIPLRVNTDRTAYAPGDRITMQVSRPESAAFATAHLSLAVILKGSRKQFHQALSPAWRPDAPEALTWLPEIRGLAISGQVRDKATGMALPGVQCWASVLGDQPQVHGIKSDAEGYFFFTLPHLAGKRTVAVTVEPIAGLETELLIQQDYSPEYADLPQLPLLLDSSDYVLLEALFLHTQVAARFPGPPADTLPRTALAYNLEVASVVRQINDFVEIPNLEEVFEEIVPGVRVRHEKAGSSLSVYDERSQIYYDDPLILLDYLPIYDVDALLGISPERIARIEVFPRRYVFGDLLLGGMVRIHTSRADLGGMLPPSQTVFLRYEGLSPVVSFPAGKYETGLPVTSSWPDLRTTLCWRPDLRLSADGLTVACFAADAAAEYEVVVQGLTENGKACLGRTKILIGKPEK
jgi:hypothetical protein